MSVFKHCPDAVSQIRLEKGKKKTIVISLHHVWLHLYSEECCQASQTSWCFLGVFFGKKSTQDNWTVSGDAAAVDDVQQQQQQAYYILILF